jgi:hypothetical protein
MTIKIIKKKYGLCEGLFSIKKCYFHSMFWRYIRNDEWSYLDESVPSIKYFKTVEDCWEYLEQIENFSDLSKVKLFL